MTEVSVKVVSSTIRLEPGLSYPRLVQTRSEPQGSRVRTDRTPWSASPANVNITIRASAQPQTPTYSPARYRFESHLPIRYYNLHIPSDRGTPHPLLSALSAYNHYIGIVAISEDTFLRRISFFSGPRRVRTQAQLTSRSIQSLSSRRIISRRSLMKSVRSWPESWDSVRYDLERRRSTSWR